MSRINVLKFRRLFTSGFRQSLWPNWFSQKPFQKVSKKHVVFITGCDTGLGFNLALLCHSMNMTVISGCHDIQSEGAKMLQDVKDSSRMITIQIDLLRDETISRAATIVQDLVSRNDYQFTALVNNAGVMCFGEFEWQTKRIFEKQIQVNLVGTMQITKQLLPLIRQQKGRIINVTSHCGLHSLPGLATYAASKAGLRFWNDALRIELGKYGVKVVNFIPGSLVAVTNIAASQQKYAEEMWNELSKEQKDFFEQYFNNYNEYLKIISEKKKPCLITDWKLLNKFKNALLSEYPRATYVHAPLRYTIYHLAFHLFPTPVSDWLTYKFVSMPEFAPKYKTK